MSNSGRNCCTPFLTTCNLHTPPTSIYSAASVLRDASRRDGRITESASPKDEEAALSGESAPVNKMLDAPGTVQKQADVPLGNQKSMGSTVVYERGRTVITATEMSTEMGKIRRCDGAGSPRVSAS